MGIFRLFLCHCRFFVIARKNECRRIFAWQSISLEFMDCHEVVPTSRNDGMFFVILSAWARNIYICILKFRDTSGYALSMTKIKVLRHFALLGMTRYPPP